MSFFLPLRIFSESNFYYPHQNPSSQPTLSVCIHCQSQSRQYWNTNNPACFRSSIASVFYDIIVSESTSRIPNREELLKLPFSFMGKTKSSLAKDFTVPWVCIFPKNPITKQDFSGGSGEQRGKKNILPLQETESVVIKIIFKPQT